MVFNTATVGSAVTPAVIQTFLSHYLNRKPLAEKPTAHISYDEGLHLIRKFLIYASHHTVEDIQRFTSQWVPHPRWVKVDEVKISPEHIAKAAEYVQGQLGHHGIEKVGGKSWWQWRRPQSELKAEWIEMRADYQERKRNKDEGKRVMLYVHGGAYFFGSVDEHRYQMQRHARKLKARVFARLAPQFPFPCGLHDCMAAYLSLLATQDPTTIILAGDSAGGGMVVSMLVIMRDQGIPLPAGAILISPWVDLTHSFPSVARDNPLDYIPPHGFHQRPSPSWPPPTTDDMLAMQEERAKTIVSKEHNINQQQSEADAVQGFHVDHEPDPGTQNATAATDKTSKGASGPVANTVPGCGRELSIIIDGNLVEIKDQIHMYASNQLISHPLVSPILQPSLGGLPPLLILTGGGEMLRDEQIYLAHKASNPTKYPPGDAFLDVNHNDHSRSQVKQWKPTDVQLQVWDDLCHVAPTLSFTRPAKYMYRSIAQFGAWALARAQDTEIEILDDDDVSIISQSDAEEDDKSTEEKKAVPNRVELAGQVGKAGDPLPPFKSHMIRQRVDRHGNIFPLEPAHQLPVCNIHASEIGVIKEGPVRKWMAAKREWDTKYASAKRRVQKQRAKEIANGYEEFGDGEVPPPSALAGRRRLGEDLTEEKKKRSKGMSLWSLWGSKHDEKTIELEQTVGHQPETTNATSTDGAGARPLDDLKADQRELVDNREKTDYSRSRSRRRTVTDQHQTEGGDVDENTTAAELLAIKRAKGESASPGDGHLTPDFMTKNQDAIPSILIQTPTADESEQKRPKAGGIAFPFSLKQDGTNASMITLTSEADIQPVEAVKTGGVDGNRAKQNGAGYETANGTGDLSEEANVSKENEKPVNDASPAIKKHTDGSAGVDKGKTVVNGHDIQPPVKSFPAGANGLLAVDH